MKHIMVPVMYLNTVKKTLKSSFECIASCCTSNRSGNTCSYSLLLFIATCFGSTEPSSSNVYTILRKLLYAQRISCCYRINYFLYYALLIYCYNNLDFLCYKIGVGIWVMCELSYLIIKILRY
jgi:hypothetical protein